MGLGRPKYQSGLSRDGCGMRLLVCVSRYYVLSWRKASDGWVLSVFRAQDAD